MGHRISVTEQSGRTVTYGYDDLYRLTSEIIANDPNGMNGSVSYTYDPVVNRTQKISTLPGYPGGLTNYNANDQLATDTYDANGNTTASGTTGYVYDFENHLISANGVTYRHDGDGHRVSKTVNGTTITYATSDINPTGYAQVLRETYSPTGPNKESQHTYIYGLEGLLELRSHYDGSGNNLTQQMYFVHDGHGSVRAITDQNGAVTDTYDYDAFGNLTHSTGASPNTTLFAGEQYDPDLGLYYNRARYLNTSTGRFWSMDTFGGDAEAPLSLHKYLYSGADPINNTDSSGHDFTESLTVAYIAVTNFAASYPVFTTVLTYTASALNIYFFATNEEYRNAFVAAGPAAAAETLAADATLITTTPEALFRNLKSAGLAADGLTQLAALRKDLSLPPAGAANDGSTLAKLDIGGTNFLGINTHGTEITLRVNPISEIHAEADVFQQAYLAKVKADEATLYIDRDMCLACGLNGAVKDMARQIGLKRLTVVMPSGIVDWNLMEP